MDIITYHASDMDLLQNDPMSFAVQVKHRNEYMGRQAQQAAIAADMRVFSGFSGGDVPYTKPRTASNGAVPLMRLKSFAFFTGFQYFICSVSASVVAR